MSSWREQPDPVSHTETGNSPGRRRARSRQGPRFLSDLRNSPAQRQVFAEHPRAQFADAGFLEDFLALFALSMDTLESRESQGSPLGKPPPGIKGERGGSTLDVRSAGKNPPRSPFSKGGGNPPTTPASLSRDNANSANLFRSIRACAARRRGRGCGLSPSSRLKLPPSAAPPAGPAPPVPRPAPSACGRRDPGPCRRCSGWSGSRCGCRPGSGPGAGFR